MLLKFENQDSDQIWKSRLWSFLGTLYMRDVVYSWPKKNSVLIAESFIGARLILGSSERGDCFEKLPVRGKSNRQNPQTHIRVLLGESGLNPKPSHCAGPSPL